MKRLADGSRQRAARVAHVAAAAHVGNADGTGSRPPQIAAARSPLAESAGLLRCGPATAWRSTIGAWPKRGRPCKASWPIGAADQPHRIADSLAADRRRSDAGPAAGAGRAAAGHRPHAAQAANRRQRQRRPIPPSARTKRSKCCGCWAALELLAGEVKIELGECWSICCRRRSWTRSARRLSGRWAASGPASRPTDR